MHLPEPQEIMFFIVFFPLFAISMACHEFAHAYVANLQGDPTAKYAGRLTLNPIPHLDPVGTFVFIISFLMGTGFGWAKPVPVNPNLFKNYRRGEILVSLAGVTANIILIFIGAVIFKVLLMTGVINLETGAGASYYLMKLVIRFMLLNLILFVFNLIPIPPLDGSHVLSMLLPREMALAYERNIAPYGMFILIGLIVFNIIDLIFIPFLRLFEIGLKFLVG